MSLRVKVMDLPPVLMFELSMSDTPPLYVATNQTKYNAVTALVDDDKDEVAVRVHFQGEDLGEHLIKFYPIDRLGWVIRPEVTYIQDRFTFPVLDYMREINSTKIHLQFTPVGQQVEFYPHEIVTAKQSSHLSRIVDTCPLVFSSQCFTGDLIMDYVLVTYVDRDTNVPSVFMVKLGDSGYKRSNVLAVPPIWHNVDQGTLLYMANTSQSIETTHTEIQGVIEPDTYYEGIWSTRLTLNDGTIYQGAGIAKRS